jgi:hypothetical protein
MENSSVACACRSIRPSARNVSLTAFNYLGMTSAVAASAERNSTGRRFEIAISQPVASSSHGQYRGA